MTLPRTVADVLADHVVFAVKPVIGQASQAAAFLRLK
jgi:hypothetical protein